MRKKFRPEPAWFSGSGAVELGRDWRRLPAGLVPEVQQVLNRYSWGTDERHLAVLESCFTADGIWEGDVMGETRVGPFVGWEEVSNWFTRFWPVQKDQRRHVFTNLIVEEADEEVVIAYALMQVYGATRGRSAFETSAACRVELRRDASGLAISRFLVGFDSPFWAPHEVETMDNWLRELFGIDPRDMPAGE